MKRLLTALAILFLLLAMVVTGCNGDTSSPSPSSPTPSISSPTGPQSGGILKVIKTYGATTVGYPPNDGDMLFAQVLTQQLLSWDSEGNVIPALAETWDLDPDTNILTFHLVHDVYFTDGTLFNAEAAKWNLQRLIEAHRMPDADNILSMDVIDQYTLKLTLNKLTSQAVVPHMKEKGYGKIINVSSLGAIYPPTHAVSYHSAKAGILGLTYDLATALAPFNIRVNAIMPGPTWTDFIRKSIKSPEAQALAVSSMGKRVPLQRVGEPEDIAGPALFFASPLSDFVTGAALPVAGGLPFESRFIQELVFKTGDKKA